MDEKKLKTHQRINDHLLGPMERASLNWLAPRMPAWVTPDFLTGVGFFSSVLIAVSYWLTTYNKNFLWLASLGFILNWFGDSLDGTLARYRKIERPRYGFFIDHSTDTLSEILIFIGLGLSPYVDLTVAFIGLISYLNISILVYLIMTTKGVFKISLAKMGPTEFRAIAILLNLGVYIIGNPTFNTPIGPVSIYNAGVVGVTLILVGFFLYEGFTTGKELMKADDYSRQRVLEKDADKQQRHEMKAQKKVYKKQRKALKKQEKLNAAQVK
jgi:archaetidylinositol phosphate synthase